MARPLTPEAIYRFADALKAASDAFDAIPWLHYQPFDDWADKLHLGDLADWVKEAERIADDWQADIDEADDRRRANPLEPGYRRLA